MVEIGQMSCCIICISAAGIIDADDADTALVASSEAIDEANLSLDLTIEPLFSEWEFFVFLLDIKDSKLLFAFFLVGG
jgi:hypothetical protein